MLIDTTFAIDLLREKNRGKEGPATAKLRTLGQVKLNMSLFVFCELLHGAHAAVRSNEEIACVEKFAELVPVLLPERSFATRYGQLAASLQSNGLPIPQMDLLIGVHAASLGTPLLTREPEHFRRIAGLVVESY